MLKSKNKYLFLIIKITISILSFFYIAYKLYKYEDYNFINLFVLNLADYYLLLIVILLMLVNWLFESKKWQILLKDIEQINIFTAIKSVFIGIFTGIFTPNRVGEYFGKVLILKKENRASGLLASFVGSIAQTLATVLFGLIALIFFFSKYRDQNSDKILLNGVLALIVFLNLYIFPKIFIYLIDKIKFLRKYKEKFYFVKHYKSEVLLKVLFISILRYFVFYLQFILLLVVFNIHSDLVNSFTLISLVFLVNTIVPSFAIAEIGIKTSAALYFSNIILGNEHNRPEIIAVFFVMWIINLIIPSIIGSILLNKNKIN